MKLLKARLITINFLEFAVWGAYLTSLGAYLAGIGLAGKIGRPRKPSVSAIFWRDFSWEQQAYMPSQAASLTSLCCSACIRYR